jgi:hypothetical protein
MVLITTGFYSPPLGAFNAFKDTPLLCGGVVHLCYQVVAVHGAKVAKVEDVLPIF